VLQLGLPPRRIDLMTSIDGVVFGRAWARRFSCELGGVQVPVIARDDLVRNKHAVGRPKDLVDLSILEGTHPMRKARRTQKTKTRRKSRG
jgi:hypothetical protein